MINPNEAMTMALEALDEINPSEDRSKKVRNALAALRLALKRRPASVPPSAVLLEMCRLDDRPRRLYIDSFLTGLRFGERYHGIGVPRSEPQKEERSL